MRISDKTGFKTKLLALLKTGITPEKLALSVALGAVLGMVPVLGMTTVICTLVAFAFRLNLAAIQLVNYFVYPVQIVLLIPFMRAGERLFGAKHLDLSLEKIRAMMAHDLWGTVSNLWSTTLHALAAWIVVAPFVLALIYIAFLPLMRRLKLERIAAPSAVSVRN